MNNTVKNPYVGPRTFQREDGDIFFGREREARDIMALVASERLVLFYAQSGAGKSSLLNTRIIPELEEGDFEALPVGRVQGDLPPDLEVENVYIYNLMNSILQQKTNPEALAKLSLSEFLCMLDFNEGGYSFNAKRTTAINMELHWRRILIIDQFEEIFTTHLDAWVHRSGFFRQLAQALNDDPYLTVILTMRDDYIASLDLYAHLLPGGLRTRYYMQRLTKETALKAVKNPVETIRPFSAGVAEKLVEDLSGIVVYRPGGTQEIQSGQYVEPVQLQVVCYSLWENLSPEGTEITAEDLQEVGDVDQSLASFYNHRVAAVAKERDISERTVREWFDKELITGNKTRNMLLQEKGSSAGLRNDVIQALQGDLVRTELRAGQIWIELSHDRLVEPVLASNAKWFEQNLSVFQLRVVLWAQQGHIESLLLGENELAEAEREAATIQLTQEEQEFLEESKKQVQRVQRDQLQRRRIASALIASMALLFVAVIAIVVAFSQRNLAIKFADESDKNAQIAKANEMIAIASERRSLDNVRKARAASNEAEKQKEIAQTALSKALAGKLAAEADSQKDWNYVLALFLSAKAYKLEETTLTRTTLFDLLQFTPSVRLYGLTESESGFAVSPDGKIIASSRCREYLDNNGCAFGEIILTNAETHQLIRKIPGEYGFVKSLAFNKQGDKLILAAGGCVPYYYSFRGCSDSQGQISFWEVTNPAKSEPVPLKKLELDNASFDKITFSHNGLWMASSASYTTIFLWDVHDPTKFNVKANIQAGYLGNHMGLAFSSDDNILVSTSGNRFLTGGALLGIWDISHPERFFELGTSANNVPPKETIYSVAFSPDGTKFASTGDDNSVMLWNWDIVTQKLAAVRVLHGHNGQVYDLTFNADSTILASAGADGKVILWDTKTGNQRGLPLSGHTNAINAIAFGSPSPGNSLFLFSDGNDNMVIQWDLSNFYPLNESIIGIEPPKENHTEAISENYIAKVENEQQVTLNGKILQNAHTGIVNSLQFGTLRDGTLLLASASDDQTVILWDVANIDSEPIFLKLDGFENPIKVAYFEDGQLVTVEKNSNRIIRWDIDPFTWAERVCKNIHLSDNQVKLWEELVGDKDYQSVCQASE